LSDEQQAFVNSQLRESEDATHTRAREKLRAQVSHFVEYLKQEGVVE